MMNKNKFYDTKIYFYLLFSTIASNYPILQTKASYFTTISMPWFTPAIILIITYHGRLFL